MNVRLNSRALFYFLSKRALLWLLVSSWLALMFAPGIAASQPHPGIQWAPIFGWFIRIVPILAVVLALDGFICYLKVTSYRIDLGEKGVSLETGILSKTQETLLYGKVQDIVIQRSVLERLLGLSSVVIQNAAGRAEVIPGLGADVAVDFRDEILKRLPQAR